MNLVIAFITSYGMLYLTAIISGLVLIIGSCKDFQNSERDSYQPAKPYVYKAPPR